MNKVTSPITDTQIVDEQLKEDNDFSWVKMLIKTSSVCFLATALVIPTLQSANPIAYYTKPYIETGTTCSLIQNRATFIFKGKLDQLFFVDQVAPKLAQTKSCLDLIVYPVNSDEYQILTRNIKGIDQVKGEALLPTNYREIVESNMDNFNLNRAEKSPYSLIQRWSVLLLVSTALTLVSVLFIMCIKL